MGGTPEQAFGSRDVGLFACPLRETYEVATGGVGRVVIDGVDALPETGASLSHRGKRSGWLWKKGGVGRGGEIPQHSSKKNIIPSLRNFYEAKKNAQIVLTPHHVSTMKPSLRFQDWGRLLGGKKAPDRMIVPAGIAFGAGVIALARGNPCPKNVQAGTVGDDTGVQAADDARQSLLGGGGQPSQTNGSCRQRCRSGVNEGVCYPSPRPGF